ncbi:MAG: DUF4157 domain-containing protein [Bacteroidetes bacterium]|nr:DUF4157 domain-containing protein [Bacteroidota bacterium]
MPAVPVQMQTTQPPTTQLTEPIEQDSSQLKSLQSRTEQTGKPNNTGLPDNLKTSVENLSGFSMDDVKVHYNSPKPQQLQAFAYAQGTDIHIGPGQEKHLPHEAWHVVQQKQGRVQATKQMKEGIAVNDDTGLENEADVMGQRALQLKHSKQLPPTAGTTAGNIIQREWIPDTDYNERWDVLIDSVQWYKDVKNRLWFRTDERKYAFWQGPVHSYTAEEWDRIELDITTPKPDHTDAITKIKRFDVRKGQSVSIGSSRPKLVYLFTAAGDATTKKTEAAFMIDTGMKQAEAAHYERVRSMGVRVPHIYDWNGKNPIVQFLPYQTTVTGQTSTGIVGGVSRVINQLRVIKQWNPAAWKAALVDLNILITTCYHSVDIQFMVDNNGGHIYVMDMEEGKAPFFDETPDPGLIAAKQVIEQEIEKQLK